MTNNLAKEHTTTIDAVVRRNDGECDQVLSRRCLWDLLAAKLTLLRR